MRRHILVPVFGLACLAAGSARTVAQPVDAPSLVTPQQAATLLDRPGIVVLHIGDRADYEKEHLPGARHLEVRTLYPAPAAGELTLQIPSPQELESRLEGLGIGDSTAVLVYMGKDSVSSLTRVAFTLDYAGLGGQTFVMDGGLPAWKAARLPVSSDIPAPPAPGTLTIKARTTSITDLASVRASAGTKGHAVIDARATEFYTGQSDGNGRIPRPGHVAGALSLPFTSFVQEDGRFKSVAEVEALLKEAGIAPGTKIATYCHIGQQATVPWFMARILGYDVQLYDGSYEEWSRADATIAPVKTGTQP
jgi:thiosulfate/3-mercaptopyruvate sulfurtransferase